MGIVQDLSVTYAIKFAATALLTPLFEVSIANYIRSCRWLVPSCAIAIALLLSDCQSSNQNPSAGTWKIYHNQRYGFEFPYPSNWVVAPMPANGDGQAFSNPLQVEVEIRGAAGYRLPENRGVHQKLPYKQPKVSIQNFTTQQGLTGELQVEVGTEISSMRLTLTQGKVLYSWQGQAPNKQFADYYQIGRASCRERVYVLV